MFAMYGYLSLSHHLFVKKYGVGFKSPTPYIIEPKKSYYEKAFLACLLFL